LGANSFGQGIDALDALGMEIITTFALVLIWLACAVDPYVRRRLRAITPDLSTLTLLRVSVLPSQYAVAA
jgi:hypothetical protein